jgi:hypothetical protein
MDREDHYVVRIYRRTREPAGVTGIVEYPGAGARVAFMNIEELRAALARKPPRANPGKPHGKPAPDDK